MQKGGYQNLVVYRLALIAYDLNILFIEKYLKKTSFRLPPGRTIDQMVQAGRSGKQNIVEGSLEKSLKMNIKLTGVARGSLGELLEDYLDFLRTNNLPVWDKGDPRVSIIKELAKQLTNSPNWTNKTNLSYHFSNWTKNPESFANLMLTILSITNYLLDKMTRSLEEKFITEGGYSENLFKKRLQARGKLD